MSAKDKIMKKAKENHGNLSFKDVSSIGIHNEYLRLMVQEGDIERIGRGQYVLTDHISDEMYSIQHRFTRGIYSHESALYLHNLTDRTPNQHVMTFPRKYNTTVVSNTGIITYRVDEKYYEIGIVELETQFGNHVNTYSIERTLCDLLRPNNKVSIDIVTDSFKIYSKTRGKNVTKLMEYAKIFKVEQRMRSYLEVLI